MWLKAIQWAGWPLAGLLFWFWLGAREDLAAEIEACNTRAAESIAEAENAVRQAEREAADRRVAQLESMLDNQQKATDSARQEADQANLIKIEQQDRILALELEADVNEIPDSTDCLIVFVPERVLPDSDCTEAGDSDGDGNGVCAGAEGADETDSTFSNITYGDSLKIWAADRAIIRTQNGQLAAIESLNEEPE